MPLDPRELVVLEEFNVTRGGNFLTLPVRINGRSYPFLLDTGCTFCCFDGALRALLGSKTRTEMAGVAGGSAQVDFYEAPPFTIGRIDFRPKEAIHADLREDLLLMGCDVFGIVGLTCLLDKVVSIDFDAGKVRFLDRVPSGAGARIPLEWSMKGKLLDGPYAVANIAGTGECRFFVDTGCVSFHTGELQKSLLDRLRTSGQVEYIGPEVSAWGIAGTVPKRMARLRQLSIGPFTHRELLVSDSSLNNKLGLRYLSRYVVTFDFPNKAMYLREGVNFSRADAIPLSGLQLFAADGRVIAADISEGSVAERAGLRQWDELAQIDDIPAKPSTLFDLRVLLTKPGTRRVVFLRDGQRRETTLHLVDLGAPQPGAGSEGDRDARRLKRNDLDRKQPAPAFQTRDRAFGKTFVSGVSAEMIFFTPTWDEADENPPVSARAALRLAENMRDSFAEAPDGYTWTPGSPTLMQQGEHCMWLVYFMAKRSGDKEKHALTVIVLMDGTAVRPAAEVAE